jgi:PAS domain S-box-containing protein
MAQRLLFLRPGPERVIPHSAPVQSMDVVEMVAQGILSMKSDAIIAADRDGQIVFWNPGAERMFGYPAGFAVGQSLDIIIPERLRERHWEGYRRVMQTGESRYGDGELLSVPGLKQDGSRISLEFTLVSLKDERGTLAGLAALLRDVTTRYEEMRALKRKLTESNAGAS